MRKINILCLQETNWVRDRAITMVEVKGRNNGGAREKIKIGMEWVYYG